MSGSFVENRAGLFGSWLTLTHDYNQIITFSSVQIFFAALFCVHVCGDY